MKSFSVCFAVLLFGWGTAGGQDLDAAVPGDNFSLEGALELFKKSESPEQFERMLNSPDSKVNNLDLDGDGYIDYVRVLDRQEGNVHIFILQAVIGEDDYQDVAVIELEKQGDGKAVLQIVGNEEVYGIETIIEPTREVRTYAGTTTTQTVVNVWAWPSVQYVYSPYYTVWVSPWRWHYHPVWWRPWRPVTYVHYYHYWRPYRPYYAVCHTRRVVYAHSMYHPYRSSSRVVRDRYHGQLTQYRSSHRDSDRDRYDDRRQRNDDQRQRPDRHNDRSVTRGESVMRRDNLHTDRAQRSEREATLLNRSASRQRNTNDNSQRDIRPAQRTSDSYTRPAYPQNRVRERQVSPEANRRSQELQRTSRPTAEPRTAPPAVQRPSPVMRRDANVSRPSPNAEYRSAPRPQTAPTVVNRSRSAAGPSTPKRSAPAPAPSKRSEQIKRGRQ